MDLIDKILEYLGIENTPEGIDTLNAMVKSNESGILDRYNEFMNAKKTSEQESRLEDELFALENLKELNGRNPTAKRSKMILDLEARLKGDR